jgi:hypothetical protein
MAAVGHDGVYIPLLVDDLPSFLRASGGADWAGFSVTIPHKASQPPPGAPERPPACLAGLLRCVLL